MDISKRDVTYGGDDQSWLGSAHGTEATRTITLDVSAFTAGTHYPDGFIPSGIVVGKITASGKYGPYDNTATDGRQAAVGHIFAAVPIRSANTIDVAGALFEHGFVVEARLPANHGLDTAGKADLKQITYR